MVTIYILFKITVCSFVVALEKSKAFPKANFNFSNLAAL